MATERLAPDALLTQSNLSGAITAIDEDVSAPDGNWLTAASNNSDSVCIVSFPSPTDNPTTGAGLQTFRIYARKFGGTSDPAYAVYLLENGARINGGAAIATGTLTTTQTITANWNAALLGIADGSAVGCEIYITKTGGSPAARATGEVGAIDWVVDYTEAGVTADLSATDGTDTTSVIGSVLIQASLSQSDGSDTAAVTVTVTVQGDLAATDGADTFAAQVGTASEVVGNLAATDAPDTGSVVCTILVQGQLSPTDTGDSADIAISVTSSGGVLITITTTQQEDLRILDAFQDSFGPDANVKAWAIQQIRGAVHSYETQQAAEAAVSAIVPVDLT